tara:strand:+ start:33 stop:407 length:375 start_codon:yes stop_codon:yes gene_type:complete
MDDQVKLALVEQKVEDLKPIIFKLDATIEKLSEVNTTVSRMLAVHEERLSKSEEIDGVLFAKIDELRDKMDRDHNDVLSRLQGIERKVWIGIGIIAAVSFVLNNPWISLSKQPEPVTIQTSYSL